MNMKVRSNIALLFIASLLLFADSAAAQESQDNQPHIQPRTTPTPTPTPTPAASQQKPPAKDKYERPPFPGDESPMRPNDAPPKAQDKYERPPFPGKGERSYLSLSGGFC